MIKYLSILIFVSQLFGQYDQLFVGSRPLSMGGAFTSVANDATAMYWNPAGLGFYKTKEVYFNQSNWIADIS